MSNNTMPERVWCYWGGDGEDGFAAVWDNEPRTEYNSAEYIRADVAQAQLDAANKRIAALEHMQKLSTESLEIGERLLKDKDARIAELEAELRRTR